MRDGCFMLRKALPAARISVDPRRKAAFTGLMRCVMLLVLLAALLPSTGCALFNRRKSQQKPPPSPETNEQVPPKSPSPIVTPDNAVVGKVSLVNDAGRFVVLTFPLGQLPPAETRLYVYRQGLKTGELRVTGQQQDVNVIADIVSGNAQKGDQVRDN
jgi:hypothetical protein